MTPETFRQQENKSNRKHFAAAAIRAIIVSLIVLSCAVYYEYAQNQDAEAYKASAAVAALNVGNPAKVDEIRKEQRLARQAAQREKALEEIRAELDASGDGIWAYFNDYVILGDSRAVGFSYYRFLRKDRVLAGGGNTVRNIYDHLDELSAIAPSSVYLCYGLNDTGVGYWKTGEEYAAELRSVFAAIRKALPKSTIVASSILPATEAAMKKSPVWRRIPDFDAALKQVCEETGVLYADNNETAKKYMDTMWGPDGVHLNSAFYPIWAGNLIFAAMEAELE